jgi:peptide/nickel transport system substrate-binding protein
LPIKRGGTVQLSSTLTIDTLDYHIMQGLGPSVYVLYEALVRNRLADYSTGEHVLEPCLASSWNLPDAQTVELELRNDVKFHDGSELNAECVKWNLDRLRSDERSRWRTQLGSIEEVIASGPSAITIRLSEPNVAILYNLVDARIQSYEHFQAVGEEAFGRNNPSGTGPMKLEEWIPDQEVRLTRFEDYWDTGIDGQPKPYFERAVDRVITDPTVALVEVRAGTIDLMERGVEAKDIQTIQDDPNAVYWEMGWTSPIYFNGGFNMSKGPFSDIRLRQAALYALDRQSMADTLGFGVGSPHYYPMWMSAWLGYDESLPKYEFDLEKAKALVQEAYPDGVEIELVPIAREPDQTIATVAAAMWEEAGITVNLNPTERLTWLEKVSAGDFDAAFYRLWLPSPDPDQASMLLMPEGGYNWLGYDNPRVTELMKQGRAELDTQKRHEIYRQVIQLTYEDAAFFSGYRLPNNFVISSRLQDMGAEYIYPRLHEAWLET